MFKSDMVKEMHEKCLKIEFILISQDLYFFKIKFSLFISLLTLWLSVWFSINAEAQEERTNIFFLKIQSL